MQAQWAMPNNILAGTDGARNNFLAMGKPYVYAREGALKDVSGRAGSALPPRHPINTEPWATPVTGRGKTLIGPLLSLAIHPPLKLFRWISYVKFAIYGSLGDICH